jgi:hypothetical protein
MQIHAENDPSWPFSAWSAESTPQDLGSICR